MLNFILKKGKKIFSILLISNHIKQNKVWEKKKSKSFNWEKNISITFQNCETKIIKGNSSFYI